MLSTDLPLTLESETTGKEHGSDPTFGLKHKPFDINCLTINCLKYEIR